MTGANRRPTSTLLAAAAVVGLVTALMAQGAAPPPVRGRAVVASDHELASQAGIEVLQVGGNAVDAAVAAALAAGVVQPAGSGLGGGGFAVLAGAGQTDPYVLDFREVAPASATESMYVGEDGKVDRKASRRGGRAVAVPGESRGLARLLAERGRLSPSRVAAPAARLAAKGFPVGGHLGKALEKSKYQQVRSLFSVGGTVATRGAVVRNPALARTLKRWGITRGEDLHTGRGAAAMVARIDEEGGLVSAEDLSAYSPKQREPVVARFGNHTLVTMPPPSSGGIVLAQVLEVLDGHDLAALGHNSSDYLHLLTEAMKHAYADRAHHLGDPDFVDVPMEMLLSEERISEIRGAIWPGRTFPTEHYGERIAPPTDAGTQHISVIDADGLGVALTTTINTSFGSGVVVSDVGIPLNNEMDDFSAKPGVPNAYGLVGGAENAIAPGKRPLSSMTPTVILDEEGEVLYVVGASGGSTIISGTLQVYLNMAVFGMDPKAAVSAPRIHHQWLPDTLFVEPEIPVDVLRSLEGRGHTLDVRPGFTAVQAARRTSDGFEAGSDPRKGGRAAAR